MVLACVFFAALLYTTSLKRRPAQEATAQAVSLFSRGQITQMIADSAVADEATEGLLRGSQEVIVRITSGAQKGTDYLVTNYVSAMYQIDAQEGTRVIVRLDPREDGTWTAFLYSYDRTGILVFMVAAFAVSLIGIGGMKGARALAGLVVTLVCIVLILFPLLEYGFPVLPVTVLIIFYVTLATFTLIDGVNKKTVSAALGTLLGVVIAGIFAFAAGRAAHVGGFQTDEAEELLLIGRDHGMQLKNLFTAGILIASLGAVMDIAMSISSAIQELHTVNPSLKVKELFRSGLNIGQDAMGTMANTLILAFAGSGFTLLLLIYFYNVSALQLFNTDLMVREVIQGVSGSLGIILSVPVVAWLASWIQIKL